MHISFAVKALLILGTLQLCMFAASSFYGFLVAACLTCLSCLILGLVIAPKKIVLGSLLFERVYFWLLLPLWAGLPFYIYGHSFLQAYSESLLGLSTVSYSTMQANLFDDNHYYMLAYYRSLLQWIGGGFIIYSSLMILKPTVISTQKSYLVKVQKALGVYVLVSVICYIAMRAWGGSHNIAFFLATATTSTGGFFPFPALQMNAFKPVCIVFMFISSLNYMNYVHGRPQIKQSYLILIAACVAMLVWRADVNLLDSVFISVNILSTTGLPIDIYPIHALFPLLGIAIFGGFLGSSTGGIGMEYITDMYKNSLRTIRHFLQKSTHHLDTPLYASHIFFICAIFMTFLFTISYSAWNIPVLDSLMMALGAVSQNWSLIAYAEHNEWFVLMHALFNACARIGAFFLLAMLVNRRYAIG